MGTDLPNIFRKFEILPGITNDTIKIETTEDDIFELDESFTIQLSALQKASFQSSSATGLIFNDDNLPKISISNAITDEGDRGETLLTFTVSLDNPSSQTVTLSYATADSTATSGDDDYEAQNGNVTFRPGDISEQIIIKVNGDTKKEGNEYFKINLSNEFNASFLDSLGEATITNDDGSDPVISVSDAIVDEGDAGIRNLVFTVTLDKATDSTVRFKYSTASGSSESVAGTDYTEIASTDASIAPAKTSLQIPVSVFGDTEIEPNDSVQLNITFAGVTNPNATMGDARGIGVINNDDASAVLNTLSISNATAAEGDTAKFVISLSAEVKDTVYFDYSVSDITTTLGADLSAVTSSFKIAPGILNDTLKIATTEDLIDELDETFRVNLSALRNASFQNNAATGTITDDDSPPTISITDPTANEGDGGQTLFTFTVTLNNPSSQTITLSYATDDNTATTADNDYEAQNGNITFIAGDLSEQIVIKVNGDTKKEGNEIFKVNLSNVFNATFAETSADGTITNDDGGDPELSVSDAIVDEGRCGCPQLNFYHYPRQSYRFDCPI